MAQCARKRTFTEVISQGLDPCVTNNTRGLRKYRLHGCHVNISSFGRQSRYVYMYLSCFNGLQMATTDHLEGDRTWVIILSGILCWQPWLLARARARRTSCHRRKAQTPFVLRSNIVTVCPMRSRSLGLETSMRHRNRVPARIRNSTLPEDNISPANSNR